MADESLRQLIASFVVEIDKAGELAKGNLAIDALKQRLQELTAEAPSAAKAVDAAFAKIGQAAGAAQGRINAPAAGIAGAAPKLGIGARIKQALAPAASSFSQGFKESSGLSGAISGVATLRNGILALGAGAAVHALTGLVDHIGDINESAMRLGVSIGDFQRLDVLAKQSGTSVGALGTAFRTLAGNAVNPTKDSTAAFAKLHVETKNADGTFKSRNDLFFETAGALADISDGTQRAALAQQIYGRSATELIPLLSEGREGLEKQRAALMALPVLTDEAVKAADELSDSWKTLGPQLLAAAGPILTGIVFPAMKAFTGWLFKASKGIADFLKTVSPMRALLSGAAIGAALGAAKLATMAGAAAQAAGGWAKLAGSMSKALFQFALLAAAFFVIEDVVSFAQGDDSLTGRLATKLFGKDGAEGIRDGVLSILEAIKQVFNYLTGQSVDSSALAKAMGVKPEGPKTAEAAAASGERTFASADDLPWYVRLAAGATGGLPDPNRHNQQTIPLPAGQYGPPQTAGSANNVSVGDTTVIVNGVNPNSASGVAGAVGRELGRGRDAIIANYVPALGT